MTKMDDARLHRTGAISGAALNAALTNLDSAKKAKSHCNESCTKDIGNQRKWPKHHPVPKPQQSKPMDGTLHCSEHGAAKKEKQRRNSRRNYSNS